MELGVLYKVNGSSSCEEKELAEFAKTMENEISFYRFKFNRQRKPQIGNQH